MKKLCQSLFCQGVCHRCFLVNYANFLRTPFLHNISGSCFCTLKHKTPDIIRSKSLKVTTELKDRQNGDISRTKTTKTRKIFCDERNYDK